MVLALAITAYDLMVAFSSWATNLARGDSYPIGREDTSTCCIDVFLHDRDPDANGSYDEGGVIYTGKMSLPVSGTFTGGPSFWPAVSGDGRYVAFVSSAGTLVSGDTNKLDDVFVRDRDSDGNGIFDELGGTTTTRASVASDGSQIQT